MSVLLSCLFLVVQLHLEFPREGVALTCTQLQQQNSPTAHSSHTSASVCVQIQAGALLEIEYIWKSPFQDFLPPLSVFFAGEFVKKLESYLPQIKAVLNYGLGQWKWHMGSAAASEATFFQEFFIKKNGLSPFLRNITGFRKKIKIISARRKERKK